MSNVRDIGHKIKSLQNMQKVTRAMNLISSIKLRKYLSMQEPAGKFLDETERLRKQIRSNLKGNLHPVVHGYPEIKKTHLVIFSADKGMCGTHNTSILKAVDIFCEKLREKGIEAEVTCFGNKANIHARHKDWEITRFEPMNEKILTPAVLRAAADEIYARFISGMIQDVWVFGKRFHSTLEQDTKIMQILPLPADDMEHSNPPVPLAAEPSGDELAQIYGGIYLQDILRSLVLQSYLSEHSARLTAMENATRNSEDMIDKYISIQNHARQAAITNELIEIVSGKEALKG